MKYALLFLLLPFGLYAAETRPIDRPESKREVTFASEGEDATSAFYYFFYRLRGAETLSKVRGLWNGGSQNKPSVTDYYLDDASILVVERAAERRDPPALIKGRDAPFQTLKEYTIKGDGDERDSTGTVTVSKDERQVLSNLISILSMTRKPVRNSSR